MTLPANHQAPRGRCTKISFLVQQRTTAQRLKALLSHSLRANLAQNTLKNVLRAKDMITKLLDGLEMFLGVGVMFLNSSNLQMAGG